jgi:soluble calcium-activated nucleotidase 1
MAATVGYKTYPSPPVETEKGLKFKIAIIADLDADSKTDGGKFYSYYKTGSLYLKGFDPSNPGASVVTVEWDVGEPTIIKSTMNLGGRGMELSELNIYKGQLYTMDDRTGVVFRLLEKKPGEIAPIPWVILGDGDGTVSKGNKSRARGCNPWALPFYHWAYWVFFSLYFFLFRYKTTFTPINPGLNP